MDIFNYFSSECKPLNELFAIFDFKYMLDLAKDCKLVQRYRKIHPLIVVKAYLDETEGQRKPSIASIWRRYSYLGELAGVKSVSCFAFSKFLCKKKFQEFLDELQKILNRHLQGNANNGFCNTFNAVKALHERIGNIDDVIAQDGSEVTVNPQAGIKAPESFNGTTGQAATKLHAGWSLSSCALAVSSFTSALSSERNEIDCAFMHNKLLICDAGYPSIKLYREIDAQGGMMLFKMKSSLKPSVISYQTYSYGQYSKEVLCNGEHIKLKDDSRFAEHCSYDCVVRFEQKNEKPLNLRVIKVYNPYFLGKTSSRDFEQTSQCAPLDGFCYLITNIPASVLDVEQIYALYRLRWNAERQFMALKSGNCFNSGKAIKEDSIKTLLKLSLFSHHLKLSVANALKPQITHNLSLLKIATSGSAIVGELISKTLSCPDRIATHSNDLNFETAVLNSFKRFKCSSVSKLNQALGKSVDCSTQILSRPPAPGGSSIP